MKLNQILDKINFKKIVGSKDDKKYGFKINETPDEEYETVRVEKVGLVPPYGLGALILKSEEGKEFPMSAFSGEVAKHIASFMDEKQEQIPTIYNLVENICEESELLLVKVKVYQSGDALRANLYFTGRKDIVLRNFRASDAIALATYYSIPIQIRKSLLEQTPQQK